MTAPVNRRLMSEAEIEAEVQRRLEAAKRHCLLTNEEAAAWMGISPSTLHQWRAKGRGPDFVKDGGMVGYTMTALEAWREARTVRHSASG